LPRIIFPHATGIAVLQNRTTARRRPSYRYMPITEKRTLSGERVLSPFDYLGYGYR